MAQQMIRIFQVGGSVRDLILRVKSKDIDYAVVAVSWEEMRNYILAKGKIYLETPEYFTIRAHIDGFGDADFVLCRKDGNYSDGRRHDTVELGTLYDDLAIRDFTMNAIAIDMQDPKRPFIDPHGGLIDIQNNLIKCVGKPEDRFNEDALRMLRALRFAVTKKMQIDLSVEACFGNRELLNKLNNRISWERKKDELFKMFKTSTTRTFELFDRYPSMRDVLLSDDKPLWLEPTLRARP